MIPSLRYAVKIKLTLSIRITYTFQIIFLHIFSQKEYFYEIRIDIFDKSIYCFIRNMILAEKVEI